MELVQFCSTQTHRLARPFVTTAVVQDCDSRLYACPLKLLENVDQCASSVALKLLKWHLKQMNRSLGGCTLHYYCAWSGLLASSICAILRECSGDLSPSMVADVLPDVIAEAADLLCDLASDFLFTSSNFDTHQLLHLSRNHLEISACLSQLVMLGGLESLLPDNLAFLSLAAANSDEKIFHIHEGLVVDVSENTATRIAALDSTTRYKVTLFAGDLTARYRCLGHRQNCLNSTRTIVPNFPNMSEADEMLRQTESHSSHAAYRRRLYSSVEESGVTCILAGGTIDVEFQIELADRRGLLLIEHCPTSVLERWSASCALIPAEYPEDLYNSFTCVEQVEIHLLDERHACLQLPVSRRIFRTIVVRHISENAAQLYCQVVQRHCARLFLAMKSCRVVQGGGIAEEAVASKISQAELRGLSSCVSNNQTLSRSEVVMLVNARLQMALRDLQRWLMNNLGHDYRDDVLDELVSKQLVWTDSATLISTLLRLGPIIINAPT